jgi:hypothetical protein
MIMFAFPLNCVCPAFYRTIVPLKYDNDGQPCCRTAMMQGSRIKARRAPASGRPDTSG